MNRIFTKFIEPCEMLGLLVEGKLALNTVQNSRKELIKNVRLSNLQVVKLSVQLEILHNITSGLLIQENNTNILVQKCWCVIYRYNTHHFRIEDNSFQLTRNKSKETIENYDKDRHRLIKCSISLLTQPQHLR